MKKTAIVTGLAFSLAIIWGVIPALAGGMNGIWKRPKTGATVQSFGCGGGLGLKVIKSKKKSSVGKVIMCGAKKVKPNQYKGTLTSTEDGKTYTGYVTFFGGTLRLSGCVFGGLICKNETWPKAR